MFTLRPCWNYVLLLLIALLPFSRAQSQPTLFDLEQWTRELSSSKDNGYHSAIEFIHLIELQDSIIIYSTLSQLESKLPTANGYFRAKYQYFLALAKFSYKSYHDISEITTLAGKAVNEANATNDTRFIAYINWLCGSLMINSQQLELALIYKLKAEEIYVGLGYYDYNYIKNWSVIGELFFNTMEYEKSIFFTKKAIHAWKEKTPAADYIRTRYYNTIAQNYEQLNKFDSALAYLDTSLALAQKGKHNDWIGINSGFKGQVYFKMGEYAKAKPLLQYDYTENKYYNQDIAAKSLQWLARINIIEGKTDSALLKSREALELVGKAKFQYYLQPSRYLEMCYYAVAESFKAAGLKDSFSRYNRMYSALHDSIQNVSLASSSRIVQMKIDNENILHAINLLHQEKKSEVIKRYLAISGIVLLSLAVVLYVRRIRRSNKNLIAKPDIIEKPDTNVSVSEVNGDHVRLTEELSNYTILTEDDWENFKRNFEKLYPGFFTTLKEKAPDITIAEQRMAALTRLNLHPKQMASMLGISVDSVHKTKQRLRHRLQMHGETNLDETILYL